MNPENTDETFDQMMRNADLDARLARLSARADRTRPAATTSPAGGSGGKRRSAARGSRRTALGLSAVTTLGLAGWMYSAAGTTSTNLASIASTSDTTATSATSATSATAATTATTAATTATTAKSSTASTTATTAASSAATSAGSSTALKDGTYTGASSTTRWGPVQVKITVSGGKITAVDVLSYPRNDNKSASINATAVPRLVQSTLTAQSAAISSVSGATYTSASYKTSLQSAIDAARAAG